MSHIGGALNIALNMGPYHEKVWEKHHQSRVTVGNNILRKRAQDYHYQKTLKLHIAKRRNALNQFVFIQLCMHVDNNSILNVTNSRQQ